MLENFGLDSLFVKRLIKAAKFQIFLSNPSHSIVDSTQYNT